MGPPHSTPGECVPTARRQLERRNRVFSRLTDSQQCHAGVRRVSSRTSARWASGARVASRHKRAVRVTASIQKKWLLRSSPWQLPIGSEVTLASHRLQFYLNNIHIQYGYAHISVPKKDRFSACFRAHFKPSISSRETPLPRTECTVGQLSIRNMIRNSR